MLRLRSIVVVTAVFAGLAACMNDFDKFEEGDGQGSDPLAAEDASPTSDAAQVPKDSSADSPTPIDAGGDACARAASCETTMTTCRSSCEQAETACIDACRTTDFLCRRDCRQKREDCSRGCRSTCRSCASGCSGACD